MLSANLIPGVDHSALKFFSGNICYLQKKFLVMFHIFCSKVDIFQKLLSYIVRL